MLNLDDTYEKKEADWVSRIIADEAVIVPLCMGDEDILYIYSISNPTGLRIWQLLDGEHSVRNIQEALTSEYQGSQEEVVESDVLEFLGDLLEVQLIERVQDETKRSERSTAAKKTGKKAAKKYEKPEISRIKMEPEQAVLSCCVQTPGAKLHLFGKNFCDNGCPTTGCVIQGNNHSPSLTVT